MAAHRYWRLRNRSVNSGQLGMGQIIMASVPGGAQECVGGTPYASGTYGGSLDTTKSFTGVAGDNWFQAGGSGYAGGWIGYDFGVGVTKDIAEVRVSGAPSDYASQMVVFDVESSDDDATYNYEWTGYYEGWSNGAVYTTFTRPAVSATNRYWALLVSNTENTNLDLVASEIGFRAAIGGAPVAPTNANYFPRNAGYPIANVHDGDLSTIIYAGVTGHGVIVWYDFGVTKNIAEIAVSSSPGGNTSRMMTSGFIMNSPDGLAYLRQGSFDFGGAVWGAEETRVAELAPPPPSVEASEVRIFAVIDAATVGLEVSQARITTAYRYFTQALQNSAARFNAVVQRDIPLRVSESRVFAVVTGRVANPRVRAWTYTLDGHDFYVLRLGDDQTLLYDVATQQWPVFETPGSGAWKPNVGFNWIGAQALAHEFGSDVVVGDDTLGILYFLDPLLPWDESPYVGANPRPFDRIVTAQTLANGRQYLPCYAIFAGGDNYGLTAPNFTPQITLETSDDQGRTFFAHETLDVEIAPDTDNPYSWYSLGQITSPGRIFRITDNGVFTRIDSIEMNDDAG